MSPADVVTVALSLAGWVALGHWVAGIWSEAHPTPRRWS